MDWVRRSFFLGAARDVASAPSNSLPTAEVPQAHCKRFLANLHLPSTFKLAGASHSPATSHTASVLDPVSCRYQAQCRGPREAQQEATTSKQP